MNTPDARDKFSIRFKGTNDQSSFVTLSQFGFE